MEGNDVRKIYVMVAIAAFVLAGGHPRFVAFSDRLAFDASAEADRHYGGSLLQVHQGLIHASCQGPRRLIIGDVPLGTTLFHIFKLILDNFNCCFFNSG